MTTKDSVILELYDTLLKLRYPEVAQISLNEFESSILTGTKRIDLLRWVIQKSSNSNCEPLSKFKDSSIKDKLVKCYTLIGLCADESILLGKCDTNKQLDFLCLLTLFIKNVHATESDSPKNKNIDDLSKADKGLETCLNSPTNITSKDNTVINSNKSQSLELVENFNSQPYIDSSSFIDELCLNLKKKTNDLNYKDHENWKPVLTEFNSAFKKIVSLPIQDNNSNVFSSYNELSTDIQKVYSSFSTVNKTLINKSQIKNRPHIDKSLRSNKYLSEVLRNNLVSLEQACNLFNN